MRYFFDACGLALLSLRGQWLRTFLSIIGIAIGIAAFTITVSINQGGRDMVFAELQTFGLHSVWVKREYTMLALGGQNRFGTGLNNDDVTDVEQHCCAAVAALTPIVSARESQQVRVRNNSSLSQVLGVGQAYVRINMDALSEGRAFNAEDIRSARPVILIGTQTRTDLFEERRAVLGETVQLGTRPYQVIGILAEKKRDFLTSIGVGKGEDPNRRILLPYTTMQRNDQRADEIDTLQLETALDTNAEQAKEQIRHILKRNHNDLYHYTGEDMQQYVQAAEHILQSIALVGLAASIMSLLVGGIGIANVMAMSVLERTREIGVRKAIGATRRAILLQFALESVAIGLIGGVLGIVISYGGLGIARQFSALAVNPSATVLLYAVLVAGMAGGIAGLYPSYAAATMNPTDALRS